MNARKIITVFIFLIIATSTISLVSATAPARLNATTDDTITYFGYNTAPGKAGYNYGIDIGDDTYYFDWLGEMIMSEYSPMFSQVSNYDLSKMDNDVDIKNAFGNTVGGLKYDTNDNEFFDFKVDKPFSFTWHGGEQVGLNDDAKVIDKIYDSNGKELKL